MNLGELARVTKVNGEKLDYELLFKQEHERRCDLEGKLAEMKKRYAGAAENTVNMQKRAERAGQFMQRINEIRRTIAARLMAALIVADEVGENEDGWYDMADKAVAAADALILTLQETKEISRRPREGR